VCVCVCVCGVCGGKQFGVSDVCVKRGCMHTCMNEGYCSFKYVPLLALLFVGSLLILIFNYV
jgi:hypothetical protein